MTTRTRLSATVDDDLLEAGRQAVAAGHADSVSAWVNLALQRQVDHDRRMTAADEFISEYEAEHGEVTADDIAVAEDWMRTRTRAVRPTGRTAS